MNIYAFSLLQYAEQARRQNSTQANQLRHCQERIESLESELHRLRTEREDMQRNVESAERETEMRFQRQLMQVLENDLTCVICTDVLIEVNRDLDIFRQCF